MKAGLLFAVSVAAIVAGGLAIYRQDAPAPLSCTGGSDGMVWVPAGEYQIGGPRRYAEEGEPRRVETEGFWIDRHEVTNAQFARFVAATGYITMAERTPDAALHPDLPADQMVPGSAVFGLKPDTGTWWTFVPGANWRAPYGPGSDIKGQDHMPVVHIAYADAAAYAAWAGGELPKEDEWEIAARAGEAGTDYEWGTEFRPEGNWRANTWQGTFPAHDSGEDGFIGLAPVGCFPPNAFGLVDMTGNVWEWTASDFSADSTSGTIRGGSYLCSSDFCARFRPNGRQPMERDFSSSHIGFRTISHKRNP